jgi:hypothetical protein
MVAALSVAEYKVKRSNNDLYIKYANKCYYNNVFSSNISRSSTS